MGMGAPNIPMVPLSPSIGPNEAALLRPQGGDKGIMYEANEGDSRGSIIGSNDIPPLYISLMEAPTNGSNGTVTIHINDQPEGFPPSPPISYRTDSDNTTSVS
jgi:hypothetical protein